MGYQASLDGLRGLSVVAVMLYHGGFHWMRGGFFGVEVFFVVSGFLITTLLIEEREKRGGTSLTQFWVRRARRLLPALFVLLLAVALWAAAFGTPEQRSQLRRDLPWSIFYVSNWGQILGDVAYYSPADPPLLRHLWSLGVEEQWYIVWPIVFVAISAACWRSATAVKVFAGCFLAIWAWTAWLTRDGLDIPMTFVGREVDRTNFVYLSTFTRAGGLLLGAAAAFVWRPWRRPSRSPGGERRGIEVAGAAAITSLVIAFCVAGLAEPSTFRWLLPFVSIMSCVAVCAVVHPAAPNLRAIFGHPSIAAIGRRSYGLYLWSWPVVVILGAREGSVLRFVAATAIAVALSEACYRYVETPVRRGWIGVQLRTLRTGRSGPASVAAARVRLAAVGVGVLVVALTLAYARVTPYDRAVGGDEAEFAVAATVPPVGAFSPATSVAGAAPLRVVVVGDSQAHALVVNQPSGIGETFDLSDGSVDGCGVFDDGELLTTRAGVERTFDGCVGWEQRWAESATDDDADIALVALGAWDVFDIALPKGVVQFGSPEFDTVFLGNLQQGIDAVAAAGTRVALLEIPCMRPVEASGAAVPPLPERGNDERVGHLNDLLRQAATANASTTAFVAGPIEWCNDPAIATDLGYRWDGVHVYKPGAKLVFETIAPALAAIGGT
jgi:peptidoglycan/LPS O-acetylase OafA/YrhL